MNEELLIHGSRTRFLRMIAIGICLVALSGWAFVDQHMWFLGGMGVIFSGFGLIVTVLMMRPGATYLRLHTAGFDIVAMKRPYRYLWTDVDGFHLTRISGAEMVAIEFNASCQAQRIGRAFAEGLTGIQGAVSNIFERPPTAIRDVLNEWKSSHEGAGQKVKVYLNPLHSMLRAAEKEKGAPLTETEVLHVRDSAVAVEMTPAQAKRFYDSLDAQVTVYRMDPDRIWEEWQEIREHGG